MMPKLNTPLDKFYDDHMKMIKDKTRKNIRTVMPIVTNIFQYIHNKDRRFKCQPVNVGSYYTLTVSRAYECDFRVVLDTPNWCSDNSSHKYEFHGKKKVVVRNLFTL